MSNAETPFIVTPFNPFMNEGDEEAIEQVRAALYDVLERV